MKKLISVTADENGEQFFFTHKKGVEIISKADITDIELDNVVFKTGSDKFKFFIAIFAVIGFIIIPNFIAAYGKKDELLFLYTCEFFLFSGFFYLFSSKINTRKILKVYSIKKVYTFKLINEVVYTDLYKYFKKQISKYLPKEGDLLLYSNNPNENTWVKTVMYIAIFIGSIATIGLIVTISGNGEFLGGFIATIVISAFFALGFNVVINYRVHYTFFSGYLEKTVYIDDISYDENINLTDLSIFRYKNFIGIKNEDIPYKGLSEYLKFWRSKQGDANNRLIIAEEFRDISPIIYEFLKEKSNQQPFV